MKVEKSIFSDVIVHWKYLWIKTPEMKLSLVLAYRFSKRPPTSTWKVNFLFLFSFLPEFWGKFCWRAEISQCQPLAQRLLLTWGVEKSDKFFLWAIIWLGNSKSKFEATEQRREFVNTIITARAQHSGQTIKDNNTNQTHRHMTYVVLVSNNWWLGQD